MLKEIILFIAFIIRKIFNSNSSTYLIIQKNKNEGLHINQIISEFEDSILEDKNVRKEVNYFFWLSGSRKAVFILRLFCKCGLIKKNHYCAVLMGPDFNKIKPYYSIASQLDIYMFDAWPSEYFPYIEQNIEKFNISHLFFSSKQVAEIFQYNSVPNCYWLPEAVDYKKYHFVNYNQKDIDILQFGRKYELVHEKLLDKLNTSTYKYYYSNDKLLFKSDLEFKEGLARSRISLCFPTSLTHPEKAGGISTMTTRYLQSMASKCLVVGRMPDEMKELFEYQPVVDLNLDEPFEHLIYILEHYNDFIPLIEKNYSIICQKQKWSDRWDYMKDFYYFHDKFLSSGSTSKYLNQSINK